MSFNNPRQRRLEIEGTKVRESELAFLINYDGRDVWFPKSQVDVIHTYKIHEITHMQLEVPEWLLEKNNLL